MTTVLRTSRFLIVAPPSFFLFVLAGLGLAMLVGSLLSREFYEGVVQTYVWQPIVHDLGYNPVNSTLLLILAALALGLVQSLFRRYGERIDFRNAIFGIALAVCGATLRVFSDADLFAPYAEPLRRGASTTYATTTCVPTPFWTLLDGCADAFLSTPIIWIWIALASLGLLRVAYTSRRVELALGSRAGMIHYAGAHAALWLGYCAIWTAEPRFIRFLPNPLLLLLAHVAAVLGIMALRHRKGVIDWRWGWTGFIFPLVVTSVYYVIVWFARTKPDWQPIADPHPWILGAYSLGTLLVVWTAARLSRSSLASGRGRVKRLPTRLGLFTGMMVLQTLLVFASLNAWARLSFDEVTFDARFALTAVAGPLLIPLSHSLASTKTAITSSRAPLLVFRQPINLLVLWSHVGDGLMTALAVDVLGAAEKHVGARILADLVSQLPLPPSLQPFPMALAFLPLKVATVCGFLWVLDYRLAPLLNAENPVWILKLAAVAYGLPAGIRDAVRLSMNV